MNPKWRLGFGIFMFAGILVADELSATEITGDITTSSLTVTGAATITSGTVKSFMVVGTPTNGSAPSGRIGEYIESVGGTSATTSGAYGDTTSISLTPGDWDITAVVYYNSATTNTVWVTGISQTSGNSSAGLIDGSNKVTDVLPSGTSHDQCQVISGYRQSLASTTTIYLKHQVVYTGSQWINYRLSARRVF